MELSLVLKAVQKVWMDLDGLSNIESEEGETVAPLLQQQSIDRKKDGGFRRTVGPTIAVEHQNILGRADKTQWLALEFLNSRDSGVAI